MNVTRLVNFTKKLIDAPQMRITDRHGQQLVDRIVQLEAENEKFKAENEKLEARLQHYYNFTNRVDDLVEHSNTSSAIRVKQYLTELMEKLKASTYVNKSN
ncbi:hypothetical protein GD1_163 [Paraglaciecola Antarctic GD virus 1]|nr:hypothetical protein GD1_163 [Paraglaciecola Antarctic GD virus 1]